MDLETFPDIIGVCEIENRKVLEDLISRPPLSEAGYRIFHRDGSDRRGIDCAVIYNPETFKILDTNTLRIKFEDTTYFSRDILYVKGKILGKQDCTGCWWWCEIHMEPNDTINKIRQWILCFIKLNPTTK